MNNDLQIKEKIKEQYGKIALIGNADSCCMPSSSSSSSSSEECCSTEVGDIYSSIRIAAKSIGYHSSELESIPSSSILGLGAAIQQNLLI